MIINAYETILPPKMVNIILSWCKFFRNFRSWYTDIRRLCVNFNEVCKIWTKVTHILIFYFCCMYMSPLLSKWSALDAGEVWAFFFECTECSKCSFLSTCCGSKAQICAKLCIDGASDILACKIFYFFLTYVNFIVFLCFNLC